MRWAVTMLLAFSFGTIASPRDEYAIDLSSLEIYESSQVPRRGHRSFETALLKSAKDDFTLLDEAPRNEAASARIVTEKPIATVSDKFLSVAVDTSQVVGGLWWEGSRGTSAGVGEKQTRPLDFDRERLLNLARNLRPAYLRIGGSEADKVYYSLDGITQELPSGFDYVFSKQDIDEIGSFASRVGYEVMFTLNGGPGYRDEEKRWASKDARRVIAYTREQGYPFTVWELGNEICGYAYVHGLKWFITGRQYARDIKELRKVVDEVAHGTKIAGPSSAYWPLLGEMGRIYESFLRFGGGEDVDILTWHYYPQQSFRCPVASRRAGPGVMLSPHHLWEVERWAHHVERLQERYAPDAEVWLGETGNAQCGGEPGVSDRFVSTLWWLDQLGRVAERGQKVTVRQTLVGSDYGLIDNSTLIPRPDYFASVLWKRLMGQRVLRVVLEGAANKNVNAYAHCGNHPEGDGALTALVLNSNPYETVVVRFPDMNGKAVIYRGTQGNPDGRLVAVNSKILSAAADGSVPRIDGATVHYPKSAPWIALPPLSWAFVVFPDAEAPACSTRTLKGFSAP